MVLVFRRSAPAVLPFQVRLREHLFVPERIAFVYSYCVNVVRTQAACEIAPTQWWAQRSLFRYNVCVSDWKKERFFTNTRLATSVTVSQGSARGTRNPRTPKVSRACPDTLKERACMHIWTISKLPIYACNPAPAPPFTNTAHFQKN